MPSLFRQCLLMIMCCTLPLLSCGQSPSSGKRDLRPKEFSEQSARGTGTLLDVRTPEEFRAGHLAGARNIDYNGDDFEKSVKQLNKEQPVFVYCRSGRRSAAAASFLRESGFRQVYELKGGILAWEKAAMPVSREADR